MCLCRAWAWKPYWLNAEVLFCRQQFRQHQYDRISQVYTDQFHIRIADIQCLSGKRQYSMYEYTQLCWKPPENQQNSHVKKHATNHGQRPFFTFCSQAPNDQHAAVSWSRGTSLTNHMHSAKIIETWIAAEAAILIGSSRSDFGARKFAIGMHGNGT